MYWNILYRVYRRLIWWRSDTSKNGEEKKWKILNNKLMNHLKNKLKKEWTKIEKTRSTRAQGNLLFLMKSAVSNIRWNSVCGTHARTMNDGICRLLLNEGISQLNIPFSSLICLQINFFIVAHWGYRQNVFNTNGHMMERNFILLFYKQSNP